MSNRTEWVLKPQPGESFHGMCARMADESAERIMMRIRGDTMEDGNEMGYASIFATEERKCDSEGSVVVTDSYEWVGDPNAPVQVSRGFLDQAPDLLDRLPWPLERIGETDRYYIYRRTDGGLL